MNNFKKYLGNIFLFVLLLPYFVLFLVITTYNDLGDTLSDILWEINLFFSTPGLIILGCVFLATKKSTRGKVVGAICIFLGFFYLGLLIWSIATGL